MDEAETVARIVRAEAYLLVEGLQVRIGLGIPTPDALPPAPRP
ncbi:hypothetical protein [Streptomyces lavenduligriseus]|nr:hypothetical protein [Streptomyces lavenduligriseus]